MQIESGVAQRIGSALYEELRLDGYGRGCSAAFRTYHIPKLTDVPHTEVLRADLR